ncbi:MAG: DinB family protein [Anaerolineales bacterium]|nr:DinB family protein [Anaerolineales bacterium]
MITSDILNPLLLSAFHKKITWLEASQRFPLDEFIETFYATRERTRATIGDLTDAQAAFSSPVHPFWSISESITHLVFTQGFYHNKLLDISTSQLAHAVEAPRGFGEGAKTNIPAKDLVTSLSAATSRIRVVIEGTYRDHNPEKIEVSPAFGKCNYNAWMLLMLGHEVDHLRQIAAMRTLAQAEAQ